MTVDEHGAPGLAQRTGPDAPDPAPDATGQVLDAERDGAADEADGQVATFTEQLADQLGGLRGLVESGVPVVVFVLVNILWTLRPAILVAVGSAVALAIWRLSRKESVRYAVNGLFGIGLGAIIAWKTGSAKGFYLPGILIGLAYGLAMLASVAFRVPLIGWVWSLLADKGSTAWRADRRMVRTFSWLTVVWALTYLAKTGVQALIFAHTSDSDPGTVLGIARLALGYPPYLLLIALTVWVVRRNHPREPAPAA
ncbi:MAG TPA: DUF3159 domain-containing protein [Rugosimonospora sp.]|nr:DUF3159 domain-containing protein [Rugosimonospora sp.]